MIYLSSISMIYTGNRRPNGDHNNVGNYGYLRSASAKNEDNSRALKCNKENDKLDNYNRDNLFPVRLLITPIQSNQYN